MEQRIFWQRQPALAFGLSLLMGSSAFLFWEFPWNWAFPLLWCLYLVRFRLFAPPLLVLGGALYSWAMYGELPPFGEGKGYFAIHSLQPHQSPFYKGLLYKGTLSFSHSRIPCSIYHRGEPHPKANSDYIVSGKWEQRGAYDFTFKVKEWIRVEKTGSLAEMRYQLKENFRLFLEKQLKRPRVAAFLGSLITGDVEERSLRYEFGRLGLQHILAISGFHFGLLMAFCSFFAGLFLPYRWKLAVLWIGVNLYFLFVGAFPAVQRSWLTAQFYLIGRFFRLNTTGLNLLGVALTAEVILNPLVSSQIGFQLSFLSCGGILLFYPLFEKVLKKGFPERTRLEFSELSFLSQHASLLSSFLRRGLSITLSVNLSILPLLLYHFHQFPLLSLLYNLFFPFFVSGALFLLLLSCLVFLLLPPMAPYFFQATDFFTSFLLNLSAYPPLCLDYSIQLTDLAPWVIPLYLSALFFISQKWRGAPSS